MTLSFQHLEEHNYSHGSDVSIIRREFVELTGNLFSAVILNQLLYWTLRVKDFDYLLEEEKKYQPKCNVAPRHGWIYKTAHELNEETMLGLSPPSIRKYLKLLIDEGWIDERDHPTEKWNKTTQYRVNIRRLQEDLVHQGNALPEVYCKAFRGSLLSNTPQNPKETADEKNFGSKTRIFPSKENPDEDAHFYKENLNQRNFVSDEKIFASKERNFASNEKFFASNTENTTENTNKEKLAAGARGNFSEGKDSGQSLGEEMISLWEQHVSQNLPPILRKNLQLTENQKSQLESLFAFHFDNDMRLWEQFCLRVKASRFMMGGGERKWVAHLDWLLREGSISKVLSGIYDNSPQEEQETFTVNPPAYPSQVPEKTAILESIKDPIWQKWCTKLSAGVRYNEFKMLHEPLSTLELEQIANARFLECEEDRLVWIGSSDQNVLSKIENLRLKIAWVIEEDYPNARTIRTRLEPSGGAHE